MKVRKDVDETLKSMSLEDQDIKSSSAIKLDGTSFEVTENTLILRKSGRGFKEKILVDLENISSTKVRKNSNKIALFLSIFFLVVGSGITYPLYLYIQWWSFIALGVGVLLFIILLCVYLGTKNIRVIINLKQGEPIKRSSKDVKSFDKINDFMDEIFYKKHK